MGKFIDLTGQIFGKLTAVERAENRGKQTMWRCRCECGNEKIVPADYLKRGYTKTCGCSGASDGKFHDLTGQVFGELKVLERIANKGGRTCYRCQCSCGKVIEVLAHSLTSGQKSCGCQNPQHQDLTGLTFGKLTVLGLNHKEKSKFGGYRYFYKCKCECGNSCIVLSHYLTEGETKSCGCLQKEKARECQLVHGWKGTLAYRTWKGIKERCYNPHCFSYPRYGGRGIALGDEWLNNAQAFCEYVSKLEHYGERGYSLDRIDNNKNYEPENLRWATPKEQCRNRRSNIIVEYQGQKMTLVEASEKSGINRATLLARMYRGETGEYLFRPVKK